MTTEKTASGDEWHLSSMEPIKQGLLFDAVEGSIQAVGSWRVAVVHAGNQEDTVTDVTLALNPAGVLSFHTEDGKLICAYPPGGWIRVTRTSRGAL